MYFISINDLDEFFLCIKQGIRPGEILQRAVDDDEKPTTTKFVFRQHLEEFTSKFKTSTKYLEDEYESIINNVSSRFETK